MTVYGVPVFEDLSVIGFACLATVYFLSFVLKGMFGLGAMPPLVIFGAWIVEPHHAVLLSLVLTAYVQVQYIPEAVRWGNWRLVGKLAFSYIPAITLGIGIFGGLDESWLGLLLGLCLLGIVAAEGSPWILQFEESVRRRPLLTGSLFAAVSGFLVGLAGAGGVMMVSLYVRIMCPEKRDFRATILIVGLLIIVWRMVVLGGSGFVTVPLLIEGLALVPFSVVGGLAGTRFFGTVSKDRFFRAFRIVLFVASANLVIKSVLEIL